MKLIRILYNICLYTFFCLALPYYIYKGIIKKKFGKGFLERFGIISSKKTKLLTNNYTIVIHAVSVGEMVTAIPLIKNLYENYGKSSNIVITVTTVTGYAIALKQKPKDVHLFYFPLDLYGSVNRFLKKINPNMVILMETELWPNFILSASKKNISLLVVNGRISEKSFDNYQKIKFLFAYISTHIKLFSVQTMDDFNRLVELGVKTDKIFINGNMKMDTPTTNKITKKEADTLKESLNISKDRLVITAGSTHPGEEKILANIYKDLNKDNSLFLILVPRHTERSPQIDNTLKSKGFKTALRTKNNCKEDTDILIVDTIGELMYFYAISDIVFVGKSLMAPGGGQNMIEPVALGKPTLFGKHISNFKQIANNMVSEKCAIMVSDEINLKTNLNHLLFNQDRRKALEEKCIFFMEQHKGALQKNLQLICRHIDH